MISKKMGRTVHNLENALATSSTLLKNNQKENISEMQLLAEVTGHSQDIDQEIPNQVVLHKELALDLKSENRLIVLSVIF